MYRKATTDHGSPLSTVAIVLLSFAVLILLLIIIGICVYMHLYCTLRKVPLSLQAALPLDGAQTVDGAQLPPPEKRTSATSLKKRDSSAKMKGSGKTGQPFLIPKQASIPALKGGGVVPSKAPVAPVAQPKIPATACLPLSIPSPPLPSIKSNKNVPLPKISPASGGLLLGPPLSPAPIRSMEKGRSRTQRVRTHRRHSPDAPTPNKKQRSVSKARGATGAQGHSKKKSLYPLVPAGGGGGAVERKKSNARHANK